METASNQQHSETQTPPEGNQSAQPQAQAQSIARRVVQARDALRARAARLPELWPSFKKRPVLGVGIAVSSGLAIAAAIGAAEAAVALSAGLLAWQALTRPTNA